MNDNVNKKINIEDHDLEIVDNNSNEYSDSADAEEVRNYSRFADAGDFEDDDLAEDDNVPVVQEKLPIEDNGTVIEFRNVTKTYKLYKSNTQKMLALFFRRKVKCKKKRAVNKVSFKVKRGEAVAFIGMNGAGKTTTMKMITEVAFPTRGEVIVKDKVNALLDLRTGFDLEFTGRQNLQLRAQLLGMNKKEIQKKEAEILEFAQLGEYIDQPLKTYPSGMAGRLGFSISILMHTEILLIDEAISAGDRSFYNKCLDKIESIIASEDVTFVLVTNSSILRKRLCKRGIVMDNGKILFDGPIEEANKFYNDFYKEKEALTVSETELQRDDELQEENADAMEDMPSEY